MHFSCDLFHTLKVHFRSDVSEDRISQVSSLLTPASCSSGAFNTWHPVFEGTLVSTEIDRRCPPPTLDFEPQVSVVTLNLGCHVCTMVQGGNNGDSARLAWSEDAREI